MTVFDRLKYLCDKQGISINTLEERIGLSKNVLYSWKKKVPGGNNLKLVADYFGVTTDYLLGRTDTPQFSRKDERDVQRLIQEMINGLSDKSYAHMNNGGEELDEEAAELLRDSLERTARRAKLLAKEKFTRNDYKKNKSK
jgi:transcriptional regulator with XRE-family HTH domain